MRRSRGIALARGGDEWVWVAWLLFAGAAVISILVLGFAGRGQALKGDEWGYAYRLGTEPLLHAILHAPPGKYLIVVPMLFYKATFSTIGIGDYLPYRLVGIALTVVVAALFFALAARRVNHLLALPGAVLILFLGSSSEITATALRIPTQVALAAGLGAFLLLERRELRADIAACALLLVSITSHPVGTAFAVAAAVLVLSRRAPERWKRAWVFGAPLVVFAAWYFALREPWPFAPSLGDQLRVLPRFEIQSLAVMAAALSGVFHWPTAASPATHFLTPLTYALAGAIILLTGTAVLTKGARPQLWAILAALIVLFGAPVFAAGGARSPTATRYILPGVVMLLLLLAEEARDVRLATPRARAVAGAVAAVFLFAIVSNAIVLERNARMWSAVGSRVRAELTALDLARGEVDPTFRPEDPSPPVPGLRAFGLDAAQYFVVVREYGSPAFTAAQLGAQAYPVQGAADVVLARALKLHLSPDSGTPHSQTASRGGSATARELQVPGHGCVTVPAHGGSSGRQIGLPPGGVTLTDTGPASELALARFGPVYGYPLTPPQSARAAKLRIPTDAIAVPWRLLIVGATRPVDICALPPSS